jgi:hypothetical protein
MIEERKKTKVMTHLFQKPFLGDTKMKKRKQTKANESQLTVPTPPWLQRQMLKNLQLAAKSKITTKRTEHAQEILKTIQKETQK